MEKSSASPAHNTLAESLNSMWYAACGGGRVAALAAVNYVFRRALFSSAAGGCASSCHQPPRGPPHGLERSPGHMEEVALTGAGVGAQKEQEASKQYKKWLESLATYSRALLGAKAALATAQVRKALHAVLLSVIAKWWGRCFSSALPRPHAESLPVLCCLFRLCLARAVWERRTCLQTMPRPRRWRTPGMACCWSATQPRARLRAQGEAKEREDDLTVFLEHADAHLLAPRAERARRKSHRASGTAADAGKGCAPSSHLPAPSRLGPRRRADLCHVKESSARVKSDRGPAVHEDGPSPPQA